MKRLMLIIVLLLISGASSQCCRIFCMDIAQDACPAYWASNSCDALSHCDLGCCLDPDGFYHNEYPMGECERKGGTFTAGVCPGIPTC